VPIRKAYFLVKDGREESEDHHDETMPLPYKYQLDFSRDADAVTVVGTEYCRDDDCVAGTRIK